MGSTPSTFPSELTIKARTHSSYALFPIDDPSSLDCIINRYGPGAKRSGGNVPRFLVGCPKDLREDKDTIRSLARIGQAAISVKRGEEVSRAIGATYLECSLKTGEGAREVFQKATESMGAGKAVRHNHKTGYQGRGVSQQGTSFCLTSSCCISLEGPFEASGGSIHA